MCKWIGLVAIISYAILFCCGCNPIEDGIAAAVEVMILDAFSTVWDTTVISVIG